MYENTIRHLVSLIIIFGHIITFLFLAILWQLGGFLFDELVTVFAIMTPIFAAYTGIAVSYVIKNATTKRKGKKWNFGSALVAVIFPLTFLFLINSIFYIKSYGTTLSDFDNVVKALGIIETTFAVYVGQLVNQMLTRFD